MINIDNIKKEYIEFIESFAGTKLSLWQKLLLESRIIHYQGHKRNVRLYEMTKLLMLIIKSILNEGTKSCIVDANNSNKYIDEIKKILEMNNIKETIKYEVQQDKIVFENGSVIEVVKSKGDNIRGHRAKVYDWL